MKTLGLKLFLLISFIFGKAQTQEVIGSIDKPSIETTVQKTINNAINYYCDSLKKTNNGGFRTVSIPSSNGFEKITLSTDSYIFTNIYICSAKSDSIKLICEHSIFPPWPTETPTHWIEVNGFYVTIIFDESISIDMIKSFNFNFLSAEKIKSIEKELVEYRKTHSNITGFHCSLSFEEIKGVSNYTWYDKSQFAPNKDNINFYQQTVIEKNRDIKDMKDYEEYLKVKHKEIYGE